MKYLQLIRIHQWIKNFFVFIPIFFAGKFFDFNLLSQSIIGFFIFCFISSSIYVLNDYLDLESDKKHPQKKNRPLANGDINKKTAVFIFILMLLFSLALCFYISNLKVIGVVVFYFFMNIAYSIKLKHVAILDVIIVAFGFLLRVFLGGFIIAEKVSIWAMLMTFFLALIMALGKRRGEIMNDSLTGKTRKSLEGYNLQFTDLAISIISTIVVVCYIMYSLNPNIIIHYKEYVPYTVIFVIAGILRYLQQTIVFNKTESPTKTVYKDLFLQMVIILWGLSFLFFIYF